MTSRHCNEGKLPEDLNWAGDGSFEGFEQFRGQNEWILFNPKKQNPDHDVIVGKTLACLDTDPTTGF